MLWSLSDGSYWAQLGRPWSRCSLRHRGLWGGWSLHGSQEGSGAWRGDFHRPTCRHWSWLLLTSPVHGVLEVQLISHYSHGPGLILIDHFRLATGEFKCQDCLWPLCNGTCQQTEAHQAECAFFKQRDSDVNISVFKKPNDVYDAILPLRVLLLKISNRR